MVANSLEHRNWGNYQSWPCPRHHNLVAFLNRFQKLEVDLNTVVSESLGTATSVGSVQLSVEQPPPDSWLQREAKPHTIVAELWKDQSSCQFCVVEVAAAAAAETDAAGGATE